MAAALLAGRPADAQDGRGAVQLSPGVVVDTAAGLAYVMSPDGGIDAVDLVSGNRRWRSTAAARPLLVTGRLLVAQAEPRAAPNDLRLVTLDTRRNGAQVLTGRVDLPLGVAAAVDEKSTAEFEASARRVANDVVVSWEYTASPMQGRRPRPDANRAEGAEPLAPPPSGVTKSAGSVRMDLRTGATSRLLGVDADPAPPRAVRLDTNRLSVSEPGEQFLSADSQHVLVSERVADDRTTENYRWTIYEIASSGRVGEVRSSVSFSPFIVQNGRIVFLAQPAIREGAAPEPKRLRAVDLASGAESWEVPVRDTESRESLPP